MVYSGQIATRDYLPSSWIVLGHKRVLETSWETGSSSASQARLLDFVDNPVLAHGNDLFGLVPVSSLQSSVDERIAVLVHIREDPVLVRQSTVEPLLGHLAEHSRPLVDQAAS